MTNNVAGVFPMEQQMSDQDWKVLLALLGTIAGWLLAQESSAVRLLWRRRWLRRQLLLELEDIQAQLRQTLIHYEGLIKIAAIGGIFPVGRVPIDAPIYNAFFTEAYAGLNRAQRVSYKTTHAQIHAVNDGFERANETLRSLDPRGATKEELKKQTEDWMALLKAEYLNVARTYTHVEFHLMNRAKPELGDSYGEVAQWFGGHDHKAADNIAEFIKFAQGKTLAELRIHMADRRI